MLALLTLDVSFLWSFESPYCSQYPQFQHKDAGFGTQAPSVYCGCWPVPRTPAKCQSSESGFCPHLFWSKALAVTVAWEGWEALACSRPHGSFPEKGKGSPEHLRLKTDTLHTRLRAQIVTAGKETEATHTCRPWRWYQVGQ